MEQEGAAVRVVRFLHRTRRRVPRLVRSGTHSGAAARARLHQRGALDRRREPERRRCDLRSGHARRAAEPAVSGDRRENSSVWTKRVTAMAHRIMRYEGEQLVPGDVAAPAGAGGLLVASMNVDPAAEPEFNEWYNAEHLPQLGAVPGVLCARRFRSSGADRERQYLALYHLTRPDVPRSDAWTKAADTEWTRRCVRISATCWCCAASGISDSRTSGNEFLRTLLSRTRDPLAGGSIHAAAGLPGRVARGAGVLRDAQPYAAVRADAGLAGLAILAWRRRSGCVLHPQRPGDRAVARELRLSPASVPDCTGGAHLSGVPGGLRLCGGGAAAGDRVRTDGVDRARQSCTRPSGRVAGRRTGDCSLRRI